ncbi:MAG: hypothetical protein CVT60_00120 [Actinobacteria bacterium HGW-Actinobacteria-10]|jgi:hypothetical protein|nr:MAG: hypothetical protein CVT60_00120 [Actinobacteria bacterium HGW-Actinobacteria-10]
MTALLRSTFATTLCLGLIALTGCATDAPEQAVRPQPLMPYTEDSPSAEESPAVDPREEGESEDLLAEIADADYASWATAPGYESLRPAAGPHGDQVQIFLDPKAENALETGADEWPIDAMIVKDVYRDGELEDIAAMKKTSQGWYWGEWTADGETVVEGLEAEPCQGCHSAGTDSTMAVDLR